MGERRRIRIRDGARQLGADARPEKPRHFWTETYHTPTWVEYIAPQPAPNAGRCRKYRPAARPALARDGLPNVHRNDRTPDYPAHPTTSSSTRQRSILITRSAMQDVQASARESDLADINWACSPMMMSGRTPRGGLRSRRHSAIRAASAAIDADPEPVAGRCNQRQQPSGRPPAADTHRPGPRSGHVARTRSRAHGSSRRRHRGTGLGTAPDRTGHQHLRGTWLRVSCS